MRLRPGKARFAAAAVAATVAAAALAWELLDRPRRRPWHRPRAETAPPHAAPRRSWRGALIGGGTGLVVLVAAVVGWRVLEARQAAAQAAALTGGDPAAGPALIRRYGCGGCHAIDGVPMARGRVGPPLAGLRERVYVAGVLPNDPDNLVRWIVDPRAVDPRTAMPVTGISPQEARDVAAYLYSLR